MLILLCSLVHTIFPSESDNTHKDGSEPAFNVVFTQGQASLPVGTPILAFEADGSLHDIRREVELAQIIDFLRQKSDPKGPFQRRRLAINISAPEKTSIGTVRGFLVKCKAGSDPSIPITIYVIGLLP